MSRRRAEVHGLWAIAAVVVAVAGLVVLNAPAAEPEPPNIVVVMFDDATAHDVAQMPEIKSVIADQGIDFTRFYATEPNCCPSRASLLTGDYVHNHRVDANDSRDGGWGRFFRRGHEQRSIAVALQQLGYRTGYFGKYLNHYGEEDPTHVPDGWDRWFATVSFNGHDNYTVNDDGTVIGPPAEDPYFDSMLGKRALDWTTESIANGAPTFSIVSVRAPKGPQTAPPDHPTGFMDAELPDKPSFNERDVDDKPAHIRGLDRLSARERKAIGRSYRTRLRLMLEPDEFVKELVETLDTNGALDDTYIVVLSDNGYMLGEHRVRSEKLVPYEESVRLPLYVRGPGIAAGSTSDSLTSMVDLFGTFVDIAGGSDLRDGRSLLPLLAGEDVPWRDAVLIENLASFQNRSPEYFGVVTATHKLVRHETKELELYDLDADPFEIRSRHRQRTALKTDLLRQLRALKGCSGATCREADVSSSP